MKKLIVFFAAILITTIVFAQVPNKMSYQAVIRNSSNALINNQAVGMKISILQNSPTGNAVYVETQTPTTNANGLASIEIGGGAVVTGNFSSINWSNGPYFCKTETDPNGGTSYTITATSQLLSVPYALFSGNGILGVSSIGDSLFLGNGTSIIIPGISVANNSGSVGGIISNPGAGITYNGQTYSSIVLGNGQEWMSENLRASNYRNGDLIATGLSEYSWETSTIGAYSIYNNNVTNIVTLNPVIPSEDESVTLTFNADQGNAALANLPVGSVIYAHTGITVNNSPWQYVVGNWGTIDNRVAMTRIGNSNQYTLTIGPSIRSWYSSNNNGDIQIGAEDFISQLCIVFRNENGSLEGKSATNSDIFVNITPTPNFSNNGLYGNLYNWYAVTDSRHLCPTGWHEPTDADWTLLTDYLGGQSVAGGKLKATGLQNWFGPNQDATNESGFSGLPGGTLYANGLFGNAGYYGVWWSSSEGNTVSAWCRSLNYYEGNVSRINNYKKLGLSVRCLRD
jgi:uncharacterized protein (TIGR02145 family)